MACAVGMPYVTQGLIKRFLHLKAPTLEFNLNQRKPVYKQGHIVAVGVAAFHGYLVGSLKIVFGPIVLVNKI